MTGVFEYPAMDPNALNNILEPRAGTGGRKNTGKVPLANILHMPEAMAGLALVMEHGAIKYSPVAERGWMGYDESETCDSLMRHLQAVMNGEATDPTSGLLHVYSVVFNAAVLAELIVKRIGDS